MKLLTDYFPILREVNIISMLLRLLLATISSGLIGRFRDKLNKEAGFKTHILVCVGCSITVLIGFYAIKYTNGLDPLRIAAQAISALGFLGAGTMIMSKDNHVIGLTTAAGLWATAAIGLAYGIGFYELGVLSTIIILFCQNILKEKLFKKDDLT